MKVFVSSTYTDLIQHRAAVNEVLLRMKAQFSAMEFFGSRGDDAVNVCADEVSSCEIFIGIYAWRYGWRPASDSLSITEQEFELARQYGKKCLCYIVDETYPWIPGNIDQGKDAQSLADLKSKVSLLVRSKFTSPDNLAKQVAADLAREMTSASPQSFGGVLRINWELFSSEVQSVLSTAYAQALEESQDGVVATRHVIAALASVPNSGRAVVTAFPNVELPELHQDLKKAEVEELFQYDQPISSCVLGSIRRLLPHHSPTQRLLAIELAVDLLKNGRGESVAKFRQAGVDGRAVIQVERLIRNLAADLVTIRNALSQLGDAEIIHLAYITNVILPTGLRDIEIRDTLLRRAKDAGQLLHLAGELMRRHPRLIDI